MKKQHDALASLFEGLTEDRFCAQEIAVDSDGIEVADSDPEACRWCAIGWAFRFAPKGGVRLAVDGVQAQAEGLGYSSVGDAIEAMGYDFIKSIRGELPTLNPPKGMA